MVTPSGLRELYDHHAWSMGALLAHAEEVTQEQAEAMPWKGVASLEDTLTHIITAERYWLANWRGEERPHFDWPESIAEVAAHWMALQAETREFLASLEDDNLGRMLELRQPIGGGRETLAAGIMHVLLHAAQHRAEAAVLLSDFGRSPGELDYIDFLEHREAMLSRA
ncbi:MAG: DinB family protein [Chloroflexi bacterium]|nr:DinB family protein [Chloroflexota bacterium]